MIRISHWLVPILQLNYGKFPDAQHCHQAELSYLLCKAGHTVSNADLAALLAEIDSLCPWYPESGSFRPKVWEDIDKKLLEEPRGPVPVLHSWYLCCDAISKISIAQQTSPSPSIKSPPVMLSTEPPLSPLLLPPPPLLPTSKSCLTECIQQAAVEEGEIHTLAICPIRLDPLASQNMSNYLLLYLKNYDALFRKVA